MGIERIKQVASTIFAEMDKVVVGQREVLTEMLVGVFAAGHVLMEGPPGVAKTLLVRSLASLLDLGFRRVQLTPDLMPSDIIGTHVFDPGQRTFVLRKGPVFTDFMLADEINRAPAKTQAALLEAMQERQTTIDGESIPLPEGFTVFATQNPIEYEGTYPLPEAELDRFLLKIEVGYPSAADEQAILARFRDGRRPETIVIAAGARAGRAGRLPGRAGPRPRRRRDPGLRDRGGAANPGGPRAVWSGPARVGRWRCSWPPGRWPRSRGATSWFPTTSSGWPALPWPTGSSSSRRSRSRGRPPRR